jgi:hypothetical protein
MPLSSRKIGLRQLITHLVVNPGAVAGEHPKRA